MIFDSELGNLRLMTQRSLSDKLHLFIVMFADRNLSSSTKVVGAWLLLYHHNSKTGLCFPSNQTVGTAIGLSAENVSRHVAKLAKAGFLLVRHRFGTSNAYDFAWSRGSPAAVKALRARLRKASPDSLTEMDMSNLRGGVLIAARDLVKMSKGVLAKATNKYLKRK